MPRPQVQQKRTFNRGNAKFGEKYADIKLVIGRYLVATKRLHDYDGHNGHGFWFGGDVIASARLGSCPSDKQPKELTANGVYFEHGIYPAGAKGNTDKGGRMTQALAQAYEEGKIFALVATCFGYYNQQADSLTQEDFEEATTRDKNEITPLRGRLIVVDRVYHRSKPSEKYPQGKDSSFYEFHPYIVADYPEFKEVSIPDWCSIAPVDDSEEKPSSDTKTEEKPSSRPAPSSSKPAAGSKPNFEEKAAAEGWTPHADPQYAKDFYEHLESGAVEATDALMVRLGY